MRNEVIYEWCIETYTDDEFQDINDNNFSDTLSFSQSDFDASEDEKTRLVLVRNEGNNDDGLENRYWAYVKHDGKLPEYFEDGAGHETNIKVPQKFHKKLMQYYKTCA